MHDIGHVIKIGHVRPTELCGYATGEFDSFAATEHNLDFFNVSSHNFLKFP